MKSITPATPHFLKSASSEDLCSDTRPSGHKIAASFGLIKVADKDNVYICPSSKDLWSVKEGKIIRLSVGEVDNGETMLAADASSPDTFLASILDELEF